MKTCVLALLAVGAISFQARAESRTQCNSEISYLKEAAQIMQDSFNHGEVSRLETSDIGIKLLSKQLSCGQILIGAYCDQAPALAEVIVKGLVEEARVGQRTEQDIIAAKLRQVEVQEPCL